MVARVQQAPVPSEVSAAPESMQLRRLRWEQHQATPGCFFFRGPPIPGREIREPLVDTGSTVRVTTRGARTMVMLGDAPFVGEGRRLSRESTFLYIRKWHVTEALRFDDETYRAGTYEYGECNSLDGPGCRSRCVINSRFTLE